jgi:hypothetical protein
MHGELLLLQEQPVEASPSGAADDLNDQAAGELLLNFANAAAISSGVRPAAPLQSHAPQRANTEPPAQLKQEWIREDTIPATHDRSAADEGRVNLLKQYLDSRTAARAGTGQPHEAVPRVNHQLGSASQFALSRADGLRVQSDSGCTVSAAAVVDAPTAEGRVRELAADMLVGSLITTELPGDAAMMTCLLPFAQACMDSHTAPTEAELQAALNRCKQRARAHLHPSENLTAVRS